MVPLTLDDLMPLADYAPRRREFFDAHRRYIERYRRVRIGSRLTLIFENRRTLWFRIQEIVRIARLSERSDVQQELDLYNRLLPGWNTLQAALLIEITEPAQMAQWRNLDGVQLHLCLDDDRIPANIVTCRPEDRLVGTAHWIQFALDDIRHGALIQMDRPARFEFDNGYYNEQSPLLSRELRQSLFDDLHLSQLDEKPLLATVAQI